MLKIKLNIYYEQYLFLLIKTYINYTEIVLQFLFLNEFGDQQFSKQ